MSYLYVNEQGSKIGYTGHRFEITKQEATLKSIPGETVENIEVFGNVQLTTQCIEECLRQGHNVTFYSSNGTYYGRLMSTGHVNVSRQRLQARLSEQFMNEVSKRIIKAKIKNQSVILRRYARNKDVNVNSGIGGMLAIAKHIDSCTDTEKLMGYEGAAARIYFNELGKLIDEEFTFTGRSRRPPKDPFNSVISLGYSMVFNEIYGKLEGKGLNPYFGMMHKDKEKHPTLVSDLMEEWRAVLVDSTAMSMFNGHELSMADFSKDTANEAVLITKDGFKRFVRKFEDKLHKEQQYLSYVDYAVSFRRAIAMQIDSLCAAMEADDPTLYIPVTIR